MTTDTMRGFRLIFLAAYLGAMLDVGTTALGVARSGAGYEQNPLGGVLITHLGWWGLAAVVTALCLVIYRAGRLTLHRPRYRRLVTAALGILALTRWIAVTTAVLFLAGR